MLDFFTKSLERKIIVKLSGEKLKIKNEDIIVNLDLDDYSFLQVELKSKDVLLTDEDNLEITTLKFKNLEDAKFVYTKLSNKLIKKNKKFRASVFVVKTVFILFVLFVFLRMYNTYLTVKEFREYQQYQEQQDMMQNYAIDSEKMDRAKGSAVSVEDIMY